MTRLASGGRIDRTKPLSFVFDGTTYPAFAGDTLASALLANGMRRVATSVALGRPRGIVSAGAEEPSGIVQVEVPFCEPMLAATTIELYDGFVGSSIAGRGRLSEEPEPPRYDAVNAHCEVLVVGGGTSGMAAAVDAAIDGQRVILIDESPALGGWCLGRPGRWTAVDTAISRVAAAAQLQVLTRTTAFGYHDDNFVVAVERRTNHLGPAAPASRARERLARERLSRERLWRIRAGRVVLATGAHERPIAFANNDLPGVMLAGSAQTYVNRYGVRPGRRAVVFTDNDSAYAAADDLAGAGVEVVAIVDVRSQTPSRADIPVLAAHVVLGADGAGGVETVTVAPRGGGSPRRFTADLLAVSGGWNPTLHLFSQSGGNLVWSSGIASFVPGHSRQDVSVTGAAAGDGLEAVEPVWFVGGADPALSFVDLQRDVTVADLRRATGAGMRSVEHVKRYTTAGTAQDQGKTSGLLASAVVADSLDRHIADIGTTTARGPYLPVAFAALAGRGARDLLDPIRVTSIHDDQVALGAAFENVGQWKRAWFYPQLGEDLDAAVRRESLAARTGVAFMDASTLGKIEIQGPDAGAFLDLIYTNMMSTLKVGSVRYGVMCHADGMVFDDGTVLRLGPERFLATTTTGNAAPVLDWMEEWLQTEWPNLHVWCTSVTEQWATVALVGPRSRAVMAELAPDLAVANDEFPFMTWRAAVVAEMDVRVARISFSGELAYEINVPWTNGPALWGAVAAAGRPYGITPYGTETMHVLRAEKGYPIVGQDTDGTCTPQDLGMDWVLSKKKADFIGRRSFARAENRRVDRKHLVGLLPVDGELRLAEGTQLIQSAVIGPPPVPMLGFVTSSYHSVALGRTFALALVHGGRDRVGSQIYAVRGDRSFAVDVVGPVVFDSEGARRDG